MRGSPGTRWLAGPLAAAALATVVLVGLFPPAPPGAVDPLGLEWATRARDRLALVAAVTGLVAASFTATASGRPSAAATDRRTLSTRTAAAVLASALAALPVAVATGAPAVRGPAFVVASLLPAALLHLALAHDRPDAGRRAAVRRLVPASYLVVGASAVVVVLTRDPFLDPGCVLHCRPGALLPSPEVAALAAATIRAVWVLLALTTAVLSGALLRRSAPGRVPCLAVTVCALTELAWAAVPGARAVLGPFRTEVPLLLPLRATAYALLGLTLLAAHVTRRRRRAVLQRMAQEVAEVTPPGDVGEVVAARLGDPHATLTFPVAGGDRRVDARGELVAETSPPAGRTEQTAVLRREGAEVARLHFDAPGARARDVEDALGPATLLALEAERTRAELLLRLAELRRTRREEVRARDMARQRAERDLHDGAQHQLLAAVFALQEALEEAREAGDLHRADLVEEVLAEVREAAGELRRLAHGLYPVLLGDAGLVPALEGLALSAQAPLTVDAGPVPRLDRSVEITAYRVARAAVQATPHRPLRVAVACQGGVLLLESHPAQVPDDQVRSLSDRAEALGGTMVSVDGTLRLELPCG